jgi:hypothetical protein
VTGPNPQADVDRPSGMQLVVVVLKRLCAEGSYEGGLNGTCYECPFASEPLERDGRVARWQDIANDPTEAYFRCHLPGRPDDVVWGEYAPCSVEEWTKAALDAVPMGD